METQIYSFTIHLEPADEGGYVVSVPALPGCITEGDTYEEALVMAEDAIRCYLESLLIDGEPVPVEQPARTPLDAKVIIRLPQPV